LLSNVQNDLASPRQNCQSSQKGQHLPVAKIQNFAKLAKLTFLQVYLYESGRPHNQELDFYTSPGNITRLDRVAIQK